MTKSAAGRATPFPGRREAHASAVLAVNLYLTRYLGRLSKAFAGDVSEAIVLGEIAHHNVSGVLAEIGRLPKLHEAVASGRINRHAYLPTNAFSIAQATGIPRQTVRRKIASLTKRGWLRATPGGLVVTAAPVGDDTVSRVFSFIGAPFCRADLRYHNLNLYLWNRNRSR